MYSLRSLLRCMLLGWTGAVLILGFCLSLWAGREASGELVTALFTRVVPPEAKPVLVPLPPKPKPAAETEAEVEPEVEPERESPPAEWLPMESDSGNGKGVLGQPKVNVLPNGSVEVFFTYTGVPGRASRFRFGHDNSLVVDLHGDWSEHLHLDIRPPESCLARLQVHRHQGFVRVSGTAHRRSGGPLLEEESMYSKEQIRITFSLPDR